MEFMQEKCMEKKTTLTTEIKELQSRLLTLLDERMFYVTISKHGQLHIDTTKKRMEPWLCYSSWEYLNGECNRGKLFNFPNFDFIVIFSSSFIISHFMIFEYFILGLSMDEPSHTRVLLKLISSKLFDRMFI